MKKRILGALLLGAGMLLPASEWELTRQEPERDFASRIVPQVQNADFSGELATVAAGTRVSSSVSDPLPQRLLSAQLERNGQPGKQGSVSSIILSVVPDETRPEGYRITITEDRIIVTGNSLHGLLYGVQSLRQLLLPSDAGVSVLPVGTVVDYPDLSWRGVFTSGLASKELRDNLEDTLSLLKMNVMIIRVDQWMKYDRYPALGHKTAAVGKDEYRAFVRRGRTLGFEMIPNHSLYSHFAWALWGEYGYLMEVPQKAISNFSTPDIDNPDTPKLIRGIMEEACEAFDSPRYYHVGQDELIFAPRPPAGKEKRPFREKFATTLKLLKKNCDELNVHMIMWADQMLDSRTGGVPENTWRLRKTLPRDVILADFTYFNSKDGFENIPLLAGDGFKVLGTSWYDPACIGRYCEVLKQTPGVLGLIASMWGGMGSYYTVPELQLAAVWAAENSWSVSRPRYEEYRNFPTDTFYFLSTILKPLVRSFRPLDLDAVARTPVSGENSMFGRGGKLDFSAVPSRLVRRDFTFALPAGKCLVLGGQTSQLPHEAVLEFAPEKVDSISFAHATDLPVRRALAFTNLDNKSFYDPKDIAVYTVFYADGGSAEIPIRYTREVTDWNEPAGAACAPVVWSGKTPGGKMARIFGYRWINPHPEKPVARITLVADKSPLSLAVFGVSLERN